MNRHPFRAEPLVFGLILLGAVVLWAVRRADLLQPDQLPYVAAAVLIVLGVIGIAGSLAPPRRPAVPKTIGKEAPDEDTDSQP